jgi:aryl-alcohol dehydrogenase-like predicted oxidoreductase
MKDLSFIGLGTAAIGRTQYINIRQEEGPSLSLSEFKQKGRTILEKAYHLGIRYFDTAPGYGMAEQLIIDWLPDHKNHFCEVASKWGYTYTANFNPNAEVHEVKEHSLEKLNEQWITTRHLLPALKYYQIHSATFESKVLNNEKVINRLAELKAEHDLIIGLTTTGADQMAVLEKAMEIEKNGQRLFGLVQSTYNIFDQSFGAMAHHLESSGVKAVIKEAMANGRVFPNQKYAHYDGAYRLLGELAEKYGVGIDAIALRFCIDSIPVFKVLSGASNEAHLKSNLKAADFELESEEIHLLKNLAVDVQHYWKERKQLQWN